MMFSNPFRPLKNLSFYAIIGLALMGVAEVFSVLIGLGQVLKPDAALDLDGEAPVSLWLMLQGLIYLFKFPAYTLSVVMFLVWLHRAHSNLEPLEGSNLEFTPGWTVGWWFIPFANLVKPFQAVREVWWESDPDVTDKGPTFLTASLRTAPTYMGVWWATWLLSNLAANITGRLYDPDTMANVEIGGVFFIISGLLSAVAAVLAITVIRDISKRQEDRFANLSLRGQAGVMPPLPPSFGTPQ